MKKADLQKIADKLSECVSEIEYIKDAAQEEWDDKSEQWQESDKGQEASGRIEALEEISATVDGAHSEINDIISSL